MMSLCRPKRGSEFFEWVFAKSPEIRTVVNKASKYFHVLIYDIKHTSYNLLVFFFFFYFI